MRREIAVVGIVAGLAIGFGLGWVIPPLLTEAPAGSILNQIKSRGEIRIGTSSDWPPFEVYNVTSDKLEGFDIDLCDLIADELTDQLSTNITINWVDMTFAGLIEACLTGVVDMLAAALFATPSRIDDLAFSMGYIRTNMVVVVLENSTITIDSLANLSAYSVGVLDGSAEMWELDDMGVPYNDYPIADTIMTLLAAETIDVAFIDEPVFTIWSKIEDLKIIHTVLAEPCSLFCRWDNPELMEVINDVILESYTDGTLDSLTEKWFA